MKKLFFFPFALLLLACSSTETEPTQISTGESQSHTIPITTALKNLENFLASTDKTRGEIRHVASVSTVRIKSSSTRGGTTGVGLENLLYVANFENNNGYAILSADDRIDESVLIITDEGSLPDNVIHDAEDVVNGERPIFSDYPTSGPGFYKTDITGDQLLINPNTVTLFIEEDQDTLVGNFNLLQSTNDNNTDNTDDSQPIDDPESIPLMYAIRYAQQWNKPDTINPDAGIIYDDNGNPIYEDPFLHTTHKYRTTYYTEKEVKPILADFKHWSQRSPFDDNMPNRITIVKKDGMITGICSKKAPAGCFPLAITKLMAIHERPTIINYKGTRIVLHDIGCETGDWKKMAASLIQKINDECDSWKFVEGTFVFPFRAIWFLRDAFFNNVKRREYKMSVVENMIDNGKPLIIFSVPSKAISESHSWNIDGYKITVKHTTTIKYINDKEVSRSEAFQKTAMVHCDFGWSGKNNGYYVSGLFKLNDPTVEHDQTNNRQETTHYDKYLYLISYDL